MILEISSTSSSETEQIASIIAANLKGGEVIEMSSDLGGGKTTFVKGLVAALGSTDHVSSPTFTISKEYTSPHFRICHFDFYRMQDPGLVAHALQEVVADEHTISCIEWSAIVEDVLPSKRLKVQIRKDATHEDMRTLTLTAPQELSYCFAGLHV